MIGARSLTWPFTQGLPPRAATDFAALLGSRAFPDAARDAAA